MAQSLGSFGVFFPRQVHSKVKQSSQYRRNLGQGSSSAMDREKHMLKIFLCTCLDSKAFFSLALLPTSQLPHLTPLFQPQANLRLLLPDPGLDLSKPINWRATTPAHAATGFITVETPNYSTQEVTTWEKHTETVPRS